MIPYYEKRVRDFEVWAGRRLAAAAHLHRHLELVLFFEGECVAYADTERCVLQAGDVFLSFPDQVHRYESSGPERYHIVVVSPDMMPELSDLFTHSLPTSALLKGAANDPALQHAMARLLELRRVQTQQQEVMRRGYLLALFGRLLSMYDLSSPPTSGSHAFKAVVEYCIRHFDKDLSLSVLERELHISKYYISHLFSDKLKMSFHDYINSIRVSAACRQLRHSDHSITEIASLVGFSTLRTFNRAFQKQLGMTPSQYRKQEGDLS